MLSHHQQSVRFPIPSCPRKRESMLQHRIPPTVSTVIPVGTVSPMLSAPEDWSSLTLMDGFPLPRLFLIPLEKGPRDPLHRDPPGNSPLVLSF